ncbi:DNA repair protein RecO [Asticcacaulis sp. YBE204]|uniref:DNA repair protein RecO n=1 Tax=Asticcacaulis sp. YBE204 TaxID=1282363 RepID=UPI0004CF31E6|nr:DNA repair protein RecO [Asticcacaulis sp. YBE204]
MQFEDDAFVLSARPHGETGAVVNVLTREHGRIAAHIAGGASRRMKPYLQPASHVRIAYRARTSEQLGSATIEPLDEGASQVFDDPVALLGVQCACVMTRAVLPEREAFPGAYHGFEALMNAFQVPAIWPYIYIRFEAGLLEAVGYGLDLTACAVTGERDDLVYVSPKSARAVSRNAGIPYADKLLALPQFLLSSQGGLSSDDLKKGFDLTGFFLERHIFHPLDRPLPEIRTRLIDAVRQS